MFGLQEVNRSLTVYRETFLRLLNTNGEAVFFSLPGRIHISMFTLDLTFSIRFDEVNTPSKGQRRPRLGLGPLGGSRAARGGGGPWAGAAPAGVTGATRRGFSRRG